MSVSIITQTSVRPESAEDFAHWQGETSVIIATFPGFIEQRLLPPNPPLQVDWVILQRFETLANAQSWLASPQRQKRIEGVGPMLVGRDDVHIVHDDANAARASTVSAIISTRVKPGMEAQYRKWERRIAAAQSGAPGLQGYRFEPAVPGVQDDHVAILRFDSQAHLDAWLNSPERRKLVEEAAPLTAEFHTRTVQSGFEQWFRDVAAPDGTPPPLWKMNLVVQLAVYPIVFLWGLYLGVPFLQGFGLGLALAVFISSGVIVIASGYLMPWIATYLLDWWLTPRSDRKKSLDALGTAAIILAYAAMVFVFWKFF